MKRILIWIIVFYQKALSPDSGVLPRIFGASRPTCIYYPSCSEYAREAIERFGARKGSQLAWKRLLRCNPFHEPGVDLVPKDL